jgi:hypothetical protein
MMRRLQRVVLCLASAAALVGCDDRAPESSLYGTWLDPTSYSDDPTYYEFRPKHTFSIVVVTDGQKTPVVDGRWYAGGHNIYLRYEEEFQGDRRPIIWHIVDISRDEIAIRVWRDGRVLHYRRVNLDTPKAFNQAMQPAAGQF